MDFEVIQICIQLLLVTFYVVFALVIYLLFPSFQIYKMGAISSFHLWDGGDK